MVNYSVVICAGWNNGRNFFGCEEIRDNKFSGARGCYHIILKV